MVTLGDHQRKAHGARDGTLAEDSQPAPVFVFSPSGYVDICHGCLVLPMPQIYISGKKDSNFCPFIQSLYSSVAEHQPGKLKALGSIPSGG